MNSQRRKIDSQGRTFIPMNMDISSNNDEFMSLHKVVVLFFVVLSYIILIAWGKSIGLNILGWILCLVLLTVLIVYLVRYVVFEERYYYKIWKRDKLVGNPKASIFWNISSIRKTPLGDILVYADLKIGCILELEKDTIIGREADSAEKHFDAWSEFYKYLNLSKYKYCQMNIMEPAGKDVRLDVLADEASHALNPGVRQVLELSVGYMKEISRATLNEMDYILVYTTNTNKMNTIINDVMEAGSRLLNGAYASVRIMTEAEIYQLPREIENVGYFDGVEAQMNVYKHSGYSIKNPLHISGVVKDNKYIKIDDSISKKLEKASKLLDNGNISVVDWDFDEIMKGKFEKLDYKSIVSDDELPDINNESVLNLQNDNRKSVKKGKLKKEKKFKTDTKKVNNSKLNKSSKRDKQVDISQVEEVLQDLDNNEVDNNEEDELF